MSACTVVPASPALDAVATAQINSLGSLQLFKTVSCTMRAPFEFHPL